MSPSILVVDDNKELVTLLTSLFEGSGYTVHGAYKGKQAIELAKAEKPSVAVVDVLLPDMMGYHVAEAIRTASAETKLIFVSGVFKGSRHSDETIKKFPGALYLEKPFDAKQLLSTVQKLAPATPRPRNVYSSLSGAFEVDADNDIAGDDNQDAMELTGVIRVSADGQEAELIQGANLTAMKSPGLVPGLRPPPREQPSKTAASQSPGRPGRQGELRDNLPGLITAFYLSKETGELYCQRGAVKKVVYFEEGQPVFAMSNLAADRFGQFLVRVGKIKPDDLNDAAVVAAETKRRTGDILVERGLLRESERMYFVAQQVKSIIYSLFGWENGNFVMSFREKARSEKIKLDVFPGNLIIRGIKKLYKPERLKRMILDADHLMPGNVPSYQLNEVDLKPWEVQLLPKIDGTITNAQVIKLSGRPADEVRAFLAAMMAIEVMQLRE